MGMGMGMDGWAEIIVAKIAQVVYIMPIDLGLSMYISTYLSIDLSIYPSMYIHLSIHLSIYLFVDLYTKCIYLATFCLFCRRLMHTK